jgi:hypothetical protein
LGIKPFAEPQKTSIAQTKCTCNAALRWHIPEAEKQLHPAKSPTPNCEGVAWPKNARYTTSSGLNPPQTPDVAFTQIFTNLLNFEIQSI